jgi:hypothetical protein
MSCAPAIRVTTTPTTLTSTTVGDDEVHEPDGDEVQPEQDL